MYHFPTYTSQNNRIRVAVISAMSLIESRFKFNTAAGVSISLFPQLS